MTTLNGKPLFVIEKEGRNKLEITRDIEKREIERELMQKSLYFLLRKPSFNIDILKEILNELKQKYVSQIRHHPLSIPRKMHVKNVVGSIVSFKWYIRNHFLYIPFTNFTLIS